DKCADKCADDRADDRNGYAHECADHSAEYGAPPRTTRTAILPGEARGERPLETLRDRRQDADDPDRPPTHAPSPKQELVAGGGREHDERSRHPEWAY